MIEPAKRRKKKHKWGITTKAKKKNAVARAIIKKGTGKIFINKRRLETIEPKQLQEMINEPLMLAGPLAKEIDIKITAKGGGFVGQGIAARAAIAKALVEYYNDETLKKRFLAYDRLLLVDDVRRKEPKKPLGIGARRHKQKSKR